MENKDIYNKCGVYAIRNLLNGKMYIGSTTTSFKKRWACHIKRLKRNKHHSEHLQNAWNKVGASNFSFIILEITTPEDSLQREGFYIDFYKSLNPQYGYNIQEISIDGFRKVSEETKKKLRQVALKQWQEGKHTNDNKKGKPSWNKGLKCENISISRRQLFSSVQIYFEGTLIVTFRSVIDLDEWTKTHILPNMKFYSDKLNRPIKGKLSSHLTSQNIHRAIRTGKLYRGFIFKKSQPLSPEMGIAKWENCWEGEIPNQQPSLELTIEEGSETNS